MEVICKCYTLLYVRDLGMSGFEYLRRVLEPTPCGHRRTAVVTCGWKSFHLWLKKHTFVLLLQLRSQHTVVTEICADLGLARRGLAVP